MGRLKNLYTTLTSKENEKLANTLFYFYSFMVIIVFIIFFYFMYIKKRIVHVPPYVPVRKNVLVNPKSPEKRPQMFVRRRPTNINDQSPIKKNYPNKFRISKIIT